MWTQSKIAIKRRLFKTVKDELICRSLAFNSHHWRSFCSKSKGVNLFGHKISSINEESKRDIIFLHGLLCQSRHWRSFALNDVFSKRAHCHLLDLRNHGESDHHSSMSYKEMAEDVIRYADQAGLNTFDLIGHAVGGKLAIAIGCLFKDRVKSIISLDAAPVDNNSDPNLLQKNIKSLDELLSLDIEGKTRKTVIDLLNEKYTDKGIANIVSMNIIYDGDQSNTVKWWTNIRGIRDILVCKKMAPMQKNPLQKKCHPSKK